MAKNLERKENDIVESWNLNWSEINENVVLNESLQKADDAIWWKEKNDESLDKRFDDLYERIYQLNMKSEKLGLGALKDWITYPNNWIIYHLDRDENWNYFKYPWNINYYKNSHHSKKYKLGDAEVSLELLTISHYVDAVESKNKTREDCMKQFKEAYPDLWDFYGIIWNPIYDLEYNRKFSFEWWKGEEGVATLDIDYSTKTAVIIDQRTNSTKKFDNILEWMKVYYDLLKKS